MTDVAVALLLVAVAVFLSRIQRLKMESEILIAAARAIVQLAAIAFLIVAWARKLESVGR